MTAEEEEDVQNELAALQRETDIVSLLPQGLPPQVDVCYQKTKAADKPIHLPAVPISDPIAPSTEPISQGTYMVWLTGTTSNYVTSTEAKAEQSEERVALPA
jgi:hypothetical protein